MSLLTKLRKIDEECSFERLYNHFYELNEKNKDGIRDLSTARVAKISRNLLGIGTIAMGSYFGYNLGDDEFSSWNATFYGSLTAVAACLAVHMHESEKIVRAVYNKKITGELSLEEKLIVRSAKKIGRYSHLAAATGLASTMITMMAWNPLFLALAPILPFWYKYTIINGYGALYSAEADFAIGERKFLENSKI